MEEINRQLNQEDYLNCIEKWKEENKGLIESGKCKKVFLECLPKYKEGRYKDKLNWKESINYKIIFIYKYREGVVEIVDYKIKSHILRIKYKEKFFEILTDSFKDCMFGKILGIKTNKFKIKLGTIINNDKQNMVITNMKYKPRYNKEGKLKCNDKWYKYTCNKCRWTEGWIEESNLIKGQGCSCCSNRTVVYGINSIADTDTWMIPYIGEECAKTHTHSSNDKVDVICPYCGKIRRKMMINNIYNGHSIGCSCSDSTPYPEKAMFSVLEQLGVNFQTQLNKTTFEWIIKDYRYDFYFELNNEQYIVETHGKQHYEDAWDKLEKTQLNDKNKKELAIKNDIKEENYIVIDCRYSELEWIKNNENGILNSRLNELFDLISNIDWNKVQEFACSNRVKEACDYKMNNPELTTTEIGKIMKLCCGTISTFLKNGSDLKWCNYNPKEEQKRVVSQNGENNGNLIEIFKNNISLGVFKSALEIERKSEALFGVKLGRTSIRKVCNNKQSSYKGFLFEQI